MKTLAPFLLAAVLIGLTCSFAVAAEPEASLARTAESVRTLARQIDALRQDNATSGDIARSTQRMINGIANGAGIDEGWVGSIFDASGFKCGAAIVTFRKVGDKRVSLFGEDDTYFLVTAGHCFGKDPTLRNTAEGAAGTQCTLLNPAGFLFGVGSRHLEDQRSAAFEALRICRHPGYDDKTLKDDIAVIEIPRPEPRLKKQVSAIAIALPEEDLLFEDRARISALGWGPSSKANTTAPESALLRIDLPISTRAHCDRPTAADGTQPVTENTICAGFETGGTGVCFGDSGSPAVFLPLPGESENLGGGHFVTHPILMGITSYSARCGINGVQSFFVDIRAYRDWISDVTLAFSQKEN